MLYPATHGALTPLWAGTSPATKDFNGKVASSSTSLSALYSTPFFKYLIPWARLGEPRADTQDPKLGKELWAWLEEQVQGV